MVDFSKLLQQSPEEREAASRASSLREYDREDMARDAASKKALVITLDREPEMRTKPDGGEIAIFRGKEPGRNSSLVAVYEKPLRAIEQADAGTDFDRQMRSLGGGDSMSLAGNWLKRRWKDREGQSVESWEFKTQHFAKGEVPLEAMLSTAKDAQREDVRPEISREPSRAVEIQRDAPAMRRGAAIAVTRGAGI